MARRMRVTGRVQGVGFRDWTRREASRDGLSGWVANRRDGSVEIHAEGDGQALDAFTARLHRGPVLARVDKVETEMAGDQGFEDFVIRAFDE